MLTQSFRYAIAGLIAISSTALCAAASAGIEQGTEPAVLPEHAMTGMEEVLSVGALVTPYLDREQLAAQLHEQARRMTEHLDAAIQNELREMLAPRLDIEVADADSAAAAVLAAAG